VMLVDSRGAREHQTSASRPIRIIRGTRKEGTLVADVHDVASYILQRQGQMTTWKLQKLVYYSQAWNLVWTDEPLFADDIEAWANGPVVRSLYNMHRGWYSIGQLPVGNPDRLTVDERATIDAVLAEYGGLTGLQLSHLSHSERPWEEAREGLGPTDYGNRVISLATMSAFYTALDMDDGAQPVTALDWSDFELT